MTDRYEQGQKTRRRVLGDAHVDRSQSRATPMEQPFLKLITEAAWGHVWSSDALTLRERSLITLALLAGLGNMEEFELHLHATRNTGATTEDVTQVLQHVAIYAGVPRANSALKLAKAILAQPEDKP